VKKGVIVIERLNPTVREYLYETEITKKYVRINEMARAAGATYKINEGTRWDGTY
jgi:hypothetical protein